MFKRRVRIVMALFFVCFAAIFGRLFDIQVLRSSDLRERGEERLQRLKQEPPRRGTILDCNGRVLAEDAPVCNLNFVPGKRKKGSRSIEFAIPGLSSERLDAYTEMNGKPKEFEKELITNLIRDEYDLVKILADITGRNRQDIAERIFRVAVRASSGTSSRMLEPRLIISDIGRTAYLKILAEKNFSVEGSSLNQVEPVLDWKRIYPYGEATCHVTGYVGKLTAEMYESIRGRWTAEGPVEGAGEIPGFFIPTETEKYIMRLHEISRAGRTIRVAGNLANETIGRAGVEYIYNQMLRGSHGQRLEKRSRPDPDGPAVMAVVDVRAEVQHGEDVQLTIDAEKQQAIYHILLQKLEDLRQHQLELVEQERMGMLDKYKKSQIREHPEWPFPVACVLMKPTTGEIKTMVSLPAFDPQRVNELYREYTRPEAQKPFINRTISEQYPPGSTFKPVVALAALSNGVITGKTEYDCGGLIRLGGHDFICMRRFAHGPLNVVDALMVSCNVFFYNAARDLGAKRLYNFVTDLGFGSKTGIDLPGETSGIIPEEAKTGYRWSTGATFHFGIGQDIAVTPLQMAVAVSAIANGGDIVTPHVIKDENLNRPSRYVNIPMNALETVRKGMWQVVNDPDYGTGRKCHLTEITVAGKTGSADWKSGAPTHAVFVAYAPFENPQIALVLLVPQGNFGGSTCAPIAREILKTYFDMEHAADTDSSNDEILD